MVLKEIVLASASPRRLELLRSLGLDVVVVPSRYREPPIAHLTPRELAVVHAREKARDVFSMRKDHLIVAADTVVDVDGIAFGKPSTADDAAKMLHILAGRDHLVHTAYTVIDPASNREEDAVESTSVRFFPLSDAEISNYVAGSEPMDKAGGYGIQGLGATLVERVEGDFYTVMGFPLARFVRTLARMGFTLHPAN